MNFDGDTRSVWRRILDFVFGYDFFISYSWLDGGTYAADLSRRLRASGFQVFLDRANYAVGDDWKKVGAWTLNRTSQLILVGSPNALTSAPVLREVEIFSRTGRRIIPIDFGGSLNWNSTEAAIARFLPTDILRIREAPEALTRGPSRETLSAIRRTFTLVRQDVKRLRAVAIIAALLGLLALAATWFGYTARRNAQEAIEQRNAAEENYKLAEQRRLSSLSRQLAIASREAPGPDRTLLISAQAVATAKTPEALGNLLERLEEWRFLHHVIHLNAGVEAIALRTEGGEVLAGLTDGRLARWAPGAATPQPPPPPGPGDGGIRALAVVGTQVWIGRADGSVEIEDEGITSIVLPASSVGSGMDRRVLAITNADGEGGKERLVAVGTAAGRLTILDARTRSVRATFNEASELRVGALAQDPSGRWLAAGTDAGTVLFLDLATLELRQRYPHIEGGVLALGFDADGRLAVVSGYGALYILREEDGEFRREASRHLAGLPASAAVDGTQGRVALGDASGMVRLYDLLGEPLAFGALRGHGNAVSALAFAGKDGLVSAAGDGTIALWDLSGASGPSTAIPSFSPEPVILRADGRGGLSAASAVEGQAGVWRLEGGVWALEADLLQVTRDAAGEEALAPPPEAVSSRTPGFVSIGEAEITALAMDQIGTAVAWATRGGFILRLPLREPKHASVLVAAERGLGDIAFSGDGSVLAFAVEEGFAVAILRSEEPGLGRKSLRLPRGKNVRALAVDGNGMTAAVGFEDGTIALFDTITGEARHEAFRVHASPVAGLLFAATGRDLISFGSGGGGADRTVAITDLRNPLAVRRLQTRQASGSVSALSTSRGSGLLAVGDHDGQILLWGLEDRRFVAQLSAGRSYVPGLLLDDAESRLVSVSSDGSFLSWNIDPTHWLALACAKANRSLRRDEWTELLPDDRYAPVCSASGEPSE